MSKQMFNKIRKMSITEFGNPNHNVVIWQFLPSMERWVCIRSYSLWYAQCEVTGIDLQKLTTEPLYRVEYGKIIKKQDNRQFAIYPANFSPNSMSYVQ